MVAVTLLVAASITVTPFECFSVTRTNGCARAGRARTPRSSAAARTAMTRWREVGRYTRREAAIIGRWDIAMMVPCQALPAVSGRGSRNREGVGHPRAPGVTKGHAWRP